MQVAPIRARKRERAPPRRAAPFRCRLVIMARAPVAGAAKTRLAREVGPRHYEGTARRVQAQALASLRRWDEAIAAFDRALNIVPDNIETMASRAEFEFFWKADTRPLHQTIDSILTQGPGAALAGGWALSGITTLSSGIPFTLNLNFDNANTGNVNWPDRLSSGRLDNPTVGRWFDTSAFKQPLDADGKTPHFGNMGRNNLNGPGLFDLDLSLFRKFKIGERVLAELRAETTNFTNTP